MRNSVVLAAAAGAAALILLAIAAPAPAEANACIAKCKAQYASGGKLHRCIGKCR